MESMKVAMHTVYHPGRSGMFETSKELCMALRAMGIEAQLLNPSQENGGQTIMDMEDVRRFHNFISPPCQYCEGKGSVDGIQPCKKCNGSGVRQVPIPKYPSDVYSEDMRHLCTVPYDWARKRADIHIMHWKADNYVEKLKPVIFAAHGTYPEYCLSTELFDSERMGSPFTGTIQRQKDADITVAFTRRQEWFLKQLQFGDVRYVPFGIDLSRYKPTGPRIKDMEGSPIVGYLEQWRDFKLPDTFIHAVKYAADTIPEIKMCIAGAEADPHLMNKLATEIGIDNRFTPASSVMARITFPEHFFRAFHIFFNPVLTGESSRTGREAMACGTPTIHYKSRWDEEPFFYRADLFDPISIGESMCKLWDEMKDDPKKVRAEARKRALDTWDIRNTANGFASVLQETLGRYDIPVGELIREDAEES